MASQDRYSCADCTKVFSKLGQYNQHRNTHSKPFKCDKCKRGFALRADVDRHMRANHRAGQFVHRCSECSFGTARKDNLSRHVRSQHRATPGNSNVQDEPQDLETKPGRDPQEDHDSPPKTNLQGSYHDNNPLVSQILIRAVETGNFELLELSLENGAYLSMHAEDESTLLHCAASAGQSTMVQYLLKAGLNPHIRNQRERTPLEEAIRGRDAETIKLLFQHKRDVEHGSDLSLALRIAIARTGSVEILEILVNHLGGALNIADRLKLLCSAARYGQLPIIEYLLSISDADIHSRDTSGKAPIHYAVKYSHTQVTKALLAHDQNGIRVRTAGGQYTLHIAATVGNIEMLELLLGQADIDINAKFYRYPGDTPLMIACKKGSIQAAELILGHEKVDVNLKNRRGLTALKEMAYLPGNEAIVSLLLKQDDIQVNYPDNFEKTALHIAAEKNNFSMVCALLQHPDIDINCKTRYQETPLHYAVLRGHIAVVRILLERIDIDLNVRTKPSGYYRMSNKTALEVAQQEGHTEIANLLLTHKQSSNPNHTTSPSPTCTTTTDPVVDSSSSSKEHNAPNPPETLFTDDPFWDEFSEEQDMEGLFISF